MNTYKRHRLPPDKIFYVSSMKSSPVCRTMQIIGKQHYLWRAVDQDGEFVAVCLQAKRDGAAAKRFFKQLHETRS